MKKIVLSLAGVLAATAFAPEAAAIPSFARQTGMACNACHFQHFPVLSTFGQAFKAAGYTMMGAQGKVEGEHLSLPNVLNTSMLIKVRYQKTSTRGAVADPINGLTTNSGQWQFPDEMSLFVGGRVAENIGVFTELSVSGGQNVNGALLAGIRIPFTFDAGAAKLSVIPFTSVGGGAAFGYELSSNATMRAIRWSEHTDASAADFIAFGGTKSTGIAFVAKNDMGYINLTRWSPVFMASAGNGGMGSVAATQATNMKNTWVRLAATPTFADWNTHIGLGFATGTGNLGTNAAAIPTETRATLLDFQGQTQLGGKDFSLYGSYARAPSSTAAATNLYNSGTVGSRKAWAVAADYSVIPHVLHVGGGFMRGDTGAATLNKDNRWQVQVIYDVAQNVALHLINSSYGGSANSGTGATTNKTTAMLEMAW